MMIIARMNLSGPCELINGFGGDVTSFMDLLRSMIISAVTLDLISKYSKM